MQVLTKVTRNPILDEILSPPLLELGLTRVRDLNWISEFEGGIAKVFRYLPLKGGQATFSWGVCFDFVPVEVNTRMKYQRNVKTASLHLFEWTKEYSSSFLGGNMAGGICSEWGEKDARKSISRLFQPYHNEVKNWYRSASTFEGAMQVARSQALSGIPYSYHWPSPDYVLSFLHARAGDLQTAEALFNTLQNRFADQTKFDEIRAMLIAGGA